MSADTFAAFLELVDKHWNTPSCWKLVVEGLNSRARARGGPGDPAAADDDDEVPSDPYLLGKSVFTNVHWLERRKYVKP
jgi:hypothetical protein